MRNFVTRSTGLDTYERNVTHPSYHASQQSRQLVRDQTIQAKRNNSFMKMKLIQSSPITHRKSLATILITAIFALGPVGAQAATTPMLLDDYSDPTRNKNGAER